jgi:ATP-binding cassette subfamily F protein 2
MAPSASKQKRLEAKAAKVSKKNTPAASVAGDDTPAISSNGSFADVNDAQAQMRRLNLATDRSAVSMIVGRVEMKRFKTSWPLSCVNSELGLLPPGFT